MKRQLRVTPANPSDVPAPAQRQLAAGGRHSAELGLLPGLASHSDLSQVPRPPRISW